MRRLIRAFDGLISSKGGTDILSVRLPLWEIKISAITCKETSREYGVLLLRYFQLNFRKLLQSKKSNANQNRIKFNRKFLRILIYCIPNTLTLDVKSVKRNKKERFSYLWPFHNRTGCKRVIHKLTQMTSKAINQNQKEMNFGLNDTIDCHF